MNSVQNNFLEPTNRNFLLSNSSFMESYSKVQNSQMSSVNEKKIGEVWSKHNFDTNKVKIENLMNLNNVQTVWGATRADTSDLVSDKHKETVVSPVDYQKSDETLVDTDVSVDHGEDVTPNADNPGQDQEETSPSHHARRPPNAFLIFCKKHRPIVRQRYPTTENRGVTKILGEWWALLNLGEKQPYNDLAKEYKDAFLTANPGFRWYKLPAPPLRTLTTRPTTISKPPATVSSPPSSTFLSEFTPGKLADESQLGGLTSLMNNNYTSAKRDESFYFKIETNNNENPEIPVADETKISDKLDERFSSPTTTIKSTLPPKPIKKRFFEQHEEDKSCSKNIFHEGGNNITQQDLLNKAVDDIFANEKDEPKEHRKSDRMCKGKRYERFMVEGKLLGNKRDTKLTQHNRFSRIDSKIEQELTLNKPIQDTPKFNLENTIKRLAKRTNIKVDLENEEGKSKTEASDNGTAKSPTITFNLDLRIENLPSLNYDDFMKRKRESKKRKMKIKSDNFHSKAQRIEASSIASSSSRPEIVPVVGSKKRKNKHSITHLNKSDTETGLDNALLGLETLAMVAASTEKIGENVSM